MKPDVIITHPLHVDTPLFRYQMRQYRDCFDKVIICFSNHYGGLDLSKPIMQFMKKDSITFLPASSPGSGDWRDHAVNRCLKHSSASHILFLEQDFIVKDGNLLSTIFSSNHRMVGFKEKSLSRFHPAFLFIERGLLDLTSLDFSARPPIHDHFGRVSAEVKEVCPQAATLEVLGFQSTEHWEHLAGLTHNYTLLIQGKEVTYCRDRFAEYNKELLSLDIEQCPDFLEVIQRAAAL